MTDPALLHKLQDEQYLYRLSSTFAWDEAIQFCNRSILGIQQAADAAASVTNSNEAGEEYFDEYLDSHFHSNHNATKISVRQWITYVYKQIAFSDQWGNTPLHSASFCKPPVDMIVALFRLARALRRFSLRAIDCSLNSSDKNNNSDSVDSDNTIYNATNLIIWAATCKDGSTPFLVASSTGASTEVLHCYLDEIQYYMDNDWSNENNLKEWARKTVIRPDSSGNTPLMGWMAYHDVWIKRQLDPSSCNIRDLGRLTGYWGLAERMLQFVTKNDLVDADHSHQEPTTCMLVQQCASISLYCPISLLEWVVSPRRRGMVDLFMSSQSVAWTPADVCAATPDRITGKLPFHVAMEARPFSFDLTSVREDRLRYTADNPRLEKNRIQMIKKLLTWYPDAATVPFKLMKCKIDTSVVAASDAIPYSGQTDMIRSRSPFLQAIAFGMTWWHTMNTADCIGEDYMGLVQLLWRLNAGQTTSKWDDVSGLYPFMLAAATATEITLDDCHDDDRLLVDTTFNLLKKDPELVTGALITKEK